MFIETLGAAAKRVSVNTINARELSGRAWDFNRTNGYQDRTNAEFVLSQTARCYLLIRAILQEINGEKRPEKTKDYFIVSNSTIF